MGFLKPTRDDAKNSSSQVLCDLDLIDTQSVSFNFHGKTHTLKPITTRVFFEFIQQVQTFAQGKFEQIDEENEAFYKTVHVVCDSIKLDDVKEMTVVQKSVLLNGIRSKIMGSQDAFVSGEKKKT